VAVVEHTPLAPPSNSVHCAECASDRFYHAVGSKRIRKRRSAHIADLVAIDIELRRGAVTFVGKLLSCPRPTVTVEMRFVKCQQTASSLLFASSAFASIAAPESPIWLLSITSCAE